MVDQPTTQPVTGNSRSPWPFVVLCLFFGGAVFLQPDMALLFSIIFFSSIAFLLIGTRQERLSAVEQSMAAPKLAKVDAYHALIDALQFPVYLLDQNATIRYANHNAHVAFGPIKNGDRITIRFRQPQLKKTIESALESQTALTTAYNEPVPDDRWFQVEISPLPKSAEPLARRDSLFLLAFHDQTEARRIDQMRSDFIANASHELRTPLASLLGYIETIKGPAKHDLEARDRFTDVMLDQAERMSRLVNDLLSLSRIEMKAHVKPSDVVSMREILKAVIASLEGLAIQMNVRIELDAEENLQIVGDRDELIQVFENLVENGCKYGQEGEQVIVSLKRAAKPNNAHAEISVRDFGIGIAIEHQHRITERFYRVDVARSREKQGTGLGLAIVKHILNRHGSRLLVKSIPGEGAEFTVRLRLHETATES